MQDKTLHIGPAFYSLAFSTTAAQTSATFSSPALSACSC